MVWHGLGQPGDSGPGVEKPVFIAQQAGTTVTGSGLGGRISVTLTLRSWPGPSCRVLIQCLITAPASLSLPSASATVGCLLAP